MSADIKSSSVVSLQQGTVRSVGEYSIGLVTITTTETPTAVLAIWPTDRPQEHRNDFLTKFSVQAGDEFPISGETLRVVAVVSSEDGGYVKFETAESQIAPNAQNFYIIFKGTGELHGLKIEFSELEKEAAILEMWPNDYEKDAAIKKGLLSSVTTAAGKELQVADRTYRVKSITVPEKNMLGWIELEL